MWRFRSSAPPLVWIFCDGGLGMAEYETPPPGVVLPLHAGCGALARGDDGAILDWAWRTLPSVTSVEAEYAGLLLGTELAHRIRPREICFVMDSATVVGQMTVAPLTAVPHVVGVSALCGAKPDARAAPGALADALGRRWLLRLVPNWRRRCDREPTVRNASAAQTDPVDGD